MTTYTDTIKKYGIQHPQLLLLLVTFFVYANSLFNSYNLDDELVTRNHRLTANGITAIPKIFEEPYYKDDYGYAYEYRPIVLTSFAIEHQLLGESPFTSHLVNLLLYLLLVFIIYETLQVLFIHISPSILIIITFIFSLHPIHTEVVDSIKCRDELLALLFGVCSLRFALKYADNAKVKNLALSVLFLLTGMLSKQSIISFFVVIPMALLITRRVKLRSLTTLTFSYTVALYPFISIEKALLKVGFILMALAFIFLLYAISKIRVGSISLPTDNLLAYFKKQNQTQLSHNWGEKFASLKKTYNFNVYEWLLVLVITLLILYFLHRVSYVSISSTLIASFLIAIVTTHLKQTNKFMLPLLYFSIYYFVGFNGVRSEVIADACSILLLAIIVYTRDKHEILLSLITYLALSLALGVMSNEIPWNMLKFLVATGAVWMTDFKHTKSVISIAGLIILLIALDEFWRGGWSLVEIAANHVSDFLLLGTLFFIAVKKHVYATYLPYTILLIIVLSNPYTREELQIVPKSSAVVVVRETVNSLSESADFSIGPKEKDRPLHYVEAPVLENESEATKLGTSLGILLKYLKMTLLPYPMAFYYGYAEISPIEISNPIAIISIIIFTSLLITAFATIKKSPVVSLGLFTYLLSLAVFSSYQLYVPGMFADRNLFTPTIGFSIVLGGISWELERRTSKISGFITAKKMWNASLLFMIMAYSLVTVNRNFDWKDDLTLFRHDIKHVDKSAQAHNLLGLHLMQHTQTAVSQAIQQDLTREALFHFKKAQEIFPNFFNVAYDIGRVYLALNEPDSAIIAFEQALAIDSITLPSIHIQLADLYTQQRDSVSANKHLLSYIMLAPTDYSGYNKLSYLLYMDKRYSESIAVNKRAILNIPNLIDPYINIAYTFRGMKNVDSALYYLRIAERIDPTNQNVQQGIRELTENIPSTSR